MTDEREESSVPILKHRLPDEEQKFASYEARYLEDIQDHLGKIFEQECTVLHEIISFTVHVDILVYQPTRKIPFLTLATSGMSDLDMTVPEDAGDPEDYNLAELVVFLPPKWKVPEFNDEEGDDEQDDSTKLEYLPIECMKNYARMPHLLKTMLTAGQTATDDSGETLHPETTHTGFLFAPAFQFGEDMVVKARDGRRINLLNLVPLNPDELEFAIQKGGWALMDEIGDIDSLIFDPGRKSCLKRKKFFGLF